MSGDGHSTTINFSGLASGLDSANIIKAMVEARRIPINNLQYQEDLVKAHQSIYDKMQGLMSALGDAARSFKTSDGFMKLDAVSSNAQVVGAVVGSGAAEGTYSVQVQQVAQAQKTYSNIIGSSSASGEFGTGSIVIQVGSQDALTIDVDDTTSLQDVADAINDAGAGMSAGIVYDGTSYRLEVSGEDTGAANAITFTENGTTLGLTDPANTVVSAQDATVIIDNLVTVNSSTNTINNAIPGVTLQVHSTSATAQTVSTSVDDDAIVDSVGQFVAAYNAVMQAINADAMYGGHVDQTKLVGDPTLQNMTRQLQSVITSPVSGLDGGVSALSQLGIATQADGTLLLNEGSLRAQLAANPDAVAAVFTGTAGQANHGVAAAMSTLTDDYALPGMGILARVSQSMTAQENGMESRIASMEENLSMYEQTLKTQFYKLEELMSKLKSQGAYLERMQKSSKD